MYTPRGRFGGALFDKTKDAATELVGLTNAEARQRLAEFGPNAVAEEAPKSWRVLLAKFWAPIPWLLEAAIVLQIGLGEYVEASVIGDLLRFNATLGFVQEGRATAALVALKKRLAPTALVCRDGAWVRLPAGGIEVAVTGTGRTIEAIQRMIPAHAHEIDQTHLNGWSAKTDPLPNGVMLTVTASDPKEVEHIRGLGFIGILASGSHHQPHHLAMAKGAFTHTH